MKGKQAILRYLETHRTFTAKDVATECGMTINCITKNALDLERARKIVRVSKVWRTVTYRLATPEEQDGTARSCTNGIFQECRQSPAMKQIIDSVTNLDNEPQYHDEGMGCGLEDRGITDRYDACRYGWDEAMERIYGEVIPCADELDFSATDRIVAGIKADGVEEFAAKLRIPGDDQFFDALAKGVALAADDFAKQLREGADK